MTEKTFQGSEENDEEFPSNEPKLPETDQGTTTTGEPMSGSKDANELLEPDDTSVELSKQVVPFKPNPVELRDPDHGNLARQLSRTIHIRVGETEADVERALYGALRLYAGLNPEDAVESILARLAVAGTNNGMEAAARAADASNVGWAKEKYTRTYYQNSDMVVKLLEARAKHRLRRQQEIVPIPDINAPSGAQAIVTDVTETADAKNAAEIKDVARAEADGDEA